jgi:hypothetical protein
MLLRFALQKGNKADKIFQRKINPALNYGSAIINEGVANFLRK